MTSDSGDRDTWRSLFIPLEGVIFASFITLLSPYRRGRASAEENVNEYSLSASEAAMTEGAAMERSPLFALCGERADTMVCVLEDRDVCFIDMMDEREGPTEMRRLCGTGGLHNSKNSTATCAALIPIEIGYMCRLSAAVMPSSASCAVPAPGMGLSAHMGADRKTMFLRGVVGSSDGRVDVFSEYGYVFGFVAHDSPVMAVSAVYGADGVAASNVENHPPFGAATEQCFGAATANLGFITCGTDGVVLVWRRDGLALRPRAIARTSLFSRAVAWAVVQPSSRDWLLSGMGAARSSLFLHTTPSGPCELRTRGVGTLEDIGPRVPLPKAKFLARTTAIASDGEIALIARGRKIHRAALAEGRCDFMLTAPKPVVHMQLARSGIAVAACAGADAAVLVIDAKRGVVLGSYVSGLSGSVRCVGLHPGARLVVTVSKRGTVEVAAMPVALSEQRETDAEVTEAIPAARALQCLTKMQEEITEQATLEGRAAVQEALVMSRMSMPMEMNKYLHPKTAVR